jgi:hypothetical protein
MANYTLVYSSRMHSREHIQVYTPNDNCRKLMEAIFAPSREERIVISNNRYYYSPSGEFKNIFVRHKFVRK